jgi:translation initiation factor IF-2
MVNLDFIQQSDDPKTVGEITAIKKEKDQLEEISTAKYMSLSFSDGQMIDGLLDIKVKYDIFLKKFKLKIKF